MNWDRIEGNWKQFKGNVKEKWGKLTDDQLDVIAGKRDQLAGKIQETYGVCKDEAEKQISEWQKLLKKMASPEMIHRGMNASDYASLPNLPRKGRTMNKLNITAIAAAIALAFSAGALAAQGMAKDEYKAAQNSIAAEYKSAIAGCGSLS